MSVDTIGNYLTIIRNAIAVSKRTVSAPHSSMRLAITKLLEQEGFIKGYEVDESVAPQPQLIVHLKYVNGESAIHEITRVSKPGCRQYSKIKNVKPVIGGLGISILSTSKGVITDKQAKRQGVGGELVCRVW